MKEFKRTLLETVDDALRIVSAFALIGLVLSLCGSIASLF